MENRASLSTVDRLMSSYKSIILAAGNGTRMNSAVPKVLHKICGREMLNMVLDASNSASMESSVTVVPSNHSEFESVVGKRTQFAVQEIPKGTGHAILQAKHLANDVDNIIVLSGDVPLIQGTTITHMTEIHDSSQAAVTLLTSTLIPTEGMGRVVRDKSNNIQGIVEEKEASSDELNIKEVNCGVYCFRAPWVWKALESLKPSGDGEFYLTDLVALASINGLPIASVETENCHETRGVNNRIQLSELESEVRRRILNKCMINGVTIIDPINTYIDQQVEIGQDTVIHPNSFIKSGTHIGTTCSIGPGTTLINSVVGSNCEITASIVEKSTLSDGVSVGPFSHIREGSLLTKDVYVGNYCEIKNSRIGSGTKCGHFSYIGDADVGDNANIGAGTITCNYDGENKHRTVIGNNTFIGSNTMLVAPVQIGDNSVTGAGSVVTKNIPTNSRAIGAPARIFQGGGRS